MSQRKSNLAAELRPEWLRDIDARLGAARAVAGGQAGGLTPHALSDTSIHTGTLLPSQAPWALTNSISILAGNGLIGGGVLTNDVGLSVGAGTLISVDADAVNLANGTAQYQVPVTGASPFAPAWTGLSGFAGNGLSFTGGQFVVGQGAGLTVDATTVALTTPGGLSATTTNSASGNHTHAIATAAAVGLSVSTTNAAGTSASLARADHTHAIASSADVTGGQTSILASSGGNLSLVQLTTSSRVRTPLVDTAAGVSMTINPALDLILNPGSGIVRMASGDAIQASSYASQTTGWRITDAGEGDFRYLFADEMHVRSFIADLEQALAGGQIISKSVAVLATDFTLPAAGATGTLRVRDLPSAPNMAVFQAGDFVGLRQFSRASGSLTVGWAWGTVTSYADGTGGNEGTQTWTFTRHASTPGAASGTIAAESLVLDFGTSGNGFYEVNAIDGAYGQNSPYAQIVTWQTHPATQTVRTRFGNLRGITNVDGEFGLFAGNGTAVTDRYVRASSAAVELRNVPLAMYDGANNTALLSAGANNNAPSFAMGSPLPTAPLTNTGIWMGLSDGAYHFRVGDPTGQRLHWNGSSLTVVGSVTIQGGSGYNNLSDRPTSLYAVNPTEHAQLVTGRKVFVETFDDSNSIAQWESFSGNGEMSVASTAVASAGGRILRIGDNAGDDQRWLIHRRLIPYKANTLYKMTVRIRRTAGSGTVYVGMAGVAADGTTWVNTAGSNTATSNQHYFVASHINPPTTFTIYTGYLLGWGSPNGGVSGGFYRAHADVRYIRPLIIVNYSNAAGTNDIDFVEIEEYDYPGSAGLYLTPLYSGYWDGSAWRSYFDNNGKFYLNAGAGSNFLSWDGTTLTVNGAINVVGGNAATTTYVDTTAAGKANTSLNNSTISTLINGSSIRVGSGTKDSNLNGWNIDSGEIVGQLAGVDQVVMNTSGQIVAGGGNAILDSTGLSLKGATSYNKKNSLSWIDSSGNVEGRIWEARSASVVELYLEVIPANTASVRDATLTLFASGIGPGSVSTIRLDAGLLTSNANVGLWTTLTLTSPWGNNGSGWATAQYAVFGDWVVIKGLVTPSSNQAANATIATLPEAIRPSENRRFGSYAAGASCALDVLSTGVVRFSVAVNTGQSGSIECMYKR